MLLHFIQLYINRKELKLTLEGLDRDNKGEVYVDDFLDWWTGYINGYEDEDDR